MQSRLGGGEGVEGLYGSLRGSHMQRILDCMRAHCGLDATSIVVDVGAGLGRPLLHAMVGMGVAGAHGIEVDGVKCLKAAAFLRQAATTLERRGMLPPGAALPVPTIEHSDVQRVRSLDPATHAYSFWEGVPADARLAFGRLMARSTTLRCVAVVQRHMRSPDPAASMDEWYGFGGLTLVGAFPVAMSGSGQFQAYVFRRAVVGARRGRAAAPAVAVVQAAPAAASVPRSAARGAKMGRHVGGPAGVEQAVGGRVRKPRQVAAPTLAVPAAGPKRRGRPPGTRRPPPTPPIAPPSPDVRQPRLRHSTILQRGGDELETTGHATSPAQPRSKKKAPRAAAAAHMPRCAGVRKPRQQPASGVGDEVAAQQLHCLRSRRGSSPARTGAPAGVSTPARGARRGLRGSGGCSALEHSRATTRSAVKMVDARYPKDGLKVRELLFADN